MFGHGLGRRKDCAIAIGLTLIGLVACSACGGTTLSSEADACDKCEGTCLPGGRCLTTLATGGIANFDNGIAVTNSAVFWTDEHDDSNAMGYLRRVSLEGRDPKILWSGDAAYGGVTVDGEDAYFTTATAILKVSLAGGTPSTLASGLTEAFNVAVQDGRAYWTTADPPSLMAVGTNGGQASVLERGGRNCFGEGVAVEPSRVYWTSLCGVETEQQFGRLFALPVGGGAPVTVASRLYGGTSIAADADNVYVGGSGHVTKVSKATGTTTPLAAGNWQINGVAVDTTHVYWTAMVQAPPTQPSGGWAGGIVMKIPVAGGTPETLASGQIPGSIVVDATSVYWLNALDKPDRVMRLTPK